MLKRADIESWWNNFKSTHKWKTLSQNCFTTVAEALDTGGGGEGVLFVDRNVIWTPQYEAEYGDAIIEYQKYKDFEFYVESDEF